MQRSVQRIRDIAPTFFQHTQHPVVSKAIQSRGACHIFNNSKLNVVSLGGGPGNDLVGAVAFFSVFFDQHIKSLMRHRLILQHLGVSPVH